MFQYRPKREGSVTDVVPSPTYQSNIAVSRVTRTYAGSPVPDWNMVGSRERTFRVYFWDPLWIRRNGLVYDPLVEWVHGGGDERREDSGSKMSTSSVQSVSKRVWCPLYVRRQTHQGNFWGIVWPLFHVNVDGEGNPSTLSVEWTEISSGEVFMEGQLEGVWIKKLWELFSLPKLDTLVKDL